MSGLVSPSPRASRMATWLAWLLAVVALGLAPSPASAQGQAIVATVNEDVILQTDLDNRMALFIATSNLQDSPEVRRRLTPQVLQSLVDDRLKRQEARRQKVSVSGQEMDQALLSVAQQLRVPPNQLADHLAQRGAKISTLIDQVETDIAWLRTVSKIAGDRGTVSQAEIEEELERLKSVPSGTEVRVAEIFLPISDPAEAERTEALAQQIEADLRRGGSFPTLARTFSQGPTARAGGDLGWVRAGQIDPDLRSVVEGLQPGEFSAPIRGAQGLSIVYLIGRRDATNPATLKRVILEMAQLSVPIAANAPLTEASNWLGAVQRATQGVKDCADFEQKGRALGRVAQVTRLPPIPLDQLPADLQPIVEPLAVNEATQPLRLSDGLMVLMVCNRGEQTMGDQGKQAVERRLREQRMMAIAQRKLRELRRTATLDIRL